MSRGEGGAGGGVEKGPEKCHVLFEWPLKFSFQLIIFFRRQSYKRNFVLKREKGHALNCPRSHSGLCLK
jgi:hypothetical protein